MKENLIYLILFGLIICLFHRKIINRLKHIFKELENFIFDITTPHRYLLNFLKMRCFSYDRITVSSHKYFARWFYLYYRAFERAFEYCQCGLRSDGDILEFGTAGGFTARIIAILMKEKKIRSNLLVDKKV